MRWAEAARFIRKSATRAADRLHDIGLPSAVWLGRAAASLYLGALGLLFMTAWHDPSVAEAGRVSALPSLHLAFLMATGAAAALLTLSRHEPGVCETGAQEPAPSAGLSELMAQMSHELRTPLNAVIGFSDVMLRELHGPLGNVRYQEYAHHISESGGQLLKSSEEALAITEAMTALMADRSRGRRERLVAGTLVRDAWRAATAGTNEGPRLAVSASNACDIVCERRPTAQALEHLLRQALSTGAGVDLVTVMGRRQGGKRSIEIEVASLAEATPASAQTTRAAPLGGSLRVILARLLLETQGATLTCRSGEMGCWSALIEFPGRG